MIIHVKFKVKIHSKLISKNSWTTFRIAFHCHVTSIYLRTRVKFIFTCRLTQSNQSELRQNSNARNRNYNFQHIFLKVSYLFADPDRIRKIGFMVTNEKDSCSAFENNNKRCYRPRSFHLENAIKCRKNNSHFSGWKRRRFLVYFT